MPQREASKFVIHTVTATGSDQAGAAELPIVASVVVTDANGTKGVRLPPIADYGIGVELRVYNNAAAALKVYPDSGGTINAASQDAAVEMENKTPAIFHAVSATEWSAVYTPNS